ncbi:hypothetical protein JKP88DRAFT_132333, partial [Tribonema minus]
QQHEGRLCYDACKPGYTGTLDRCYKDCPAGFGNTITSCTKPASYGWGMCVWWKGGTIQKTLFDRQSCPGPSEMYASLCYPKCKTGFHNVGANVCSPDCPAGYTDFGVGCTKPDYYRGVGTP